MSELIKQTFNDLGLVKASDKSKAYELNPYDVDQMAYAQSYIDGDTHKGTQSGLSYNTLKFLARMPLVSAIIQTRVNQVAEFAHNQQDRYSAGFVIQTKDQKEETTDEQKEQITTLTKWLNQCGDSRISGHTTFEMFIRMIVRDSLMYDQCNFEVIYSGGKPVAFKAVDASTMRRTAPSKEELKTGKRDKSKSTFVQIIDNKKVAEFKRHEMAWGVRRPRADIMVNGYGFPELEESAPTIIDMMHSKAYNSANFTHGLHLSGILAVKSKMSPALFRAFRREFYAMLQGGNGAKKTPIIQLDPESKEEISSVNLSNSNSDMEFDKWLNFLIKETCAIFQMDPSELGFVYGNEGQTSSLNSGDTGNRIKFSKEKGLRPLLRALQTWINRWIIEPLSEDLELVFVGLDVESEDKRIERMQKKLKMFMTVNEARAQFDLEPLETGGDLILDPSWINAKMSADSMGEEEEEGFEEEEDFEEDETEETQDEDIEIDEEV